MALILVSVNTTGILDGDETLELLDQEADGLEMKGEMLPAIILCEIAGPQHHHLLPDLEKCKVSPSLLSLYAT